MPEYLPLGAFRQGLLPGDCGSCAWWLTAGTAPALGAAAAATRHEWLTDLEHEWGYAGLLMHEQDGRHGANTPADPVVIASVQFAPPSALPRLRELPFPPLPAFSALLFCLRLAENAPRWAGKRLVRRALYELRRRGIDEVYAVASRGGREDGPGLDCRFFSMESLVENGFAEVAGNGHIALMRVDNRGLISIMDRAESLFRRIFARQEEPAPSPAAWAEAKNGTER